MDRKYPHIEDLVLIKGKVQLPWEVGVETREECSKFYPEAKVHKGCLIMRQSRRIKKPL